MSSFVALPTLSEVPWIVVAFALAVVAAVGFSSSSQQALKIAWLYFAIGAITLGAVSQFYLARVLFSFVPQSITEFWRKRADESARTEVFNQREKLSVRQGDIKDKRAIELLCCKIWHGIKLLPCTPSGIDYLLLEGPNKSGGREIIGCLGYCRNPALCHCRLTRVRYATRICEPFRAPLIYVPIVAVQERFQGMRLDEILLDKFLDDKVVGKGVMLAGDFGDLIKREGITCEQKVVEVVVSTTLYQKLIKSDRK